MGKMNGCEGLKAQGRTVSGQPERAPQCKALGKVHHGPPAALAGRKLSTGQHRVVGADPRAREHLHQQHSQSRQRDKAHRSRHRQGGVCAQHLRLPHRLQGQQRQQHIAAQQMQAHNRGEELHGHRQRAKRTLDADPYQGSRGPPGAQQSVRCGARLAPRLPPGTHRKYQNQQAHTRRQIAVHHFNPGFAVGDWAVRRCCLRQGDRSLRTYGGGVAVTTRPIRAAQAAIGQAGKGAKQHQVEGQKQSKQGQGLQTPDRLRLALAPRPPGQRASGQQQAHQG